MYYRRNEAFRYSFDPMLTGKFIANNDIKGELQILDLSVQGMKVELPERDFQKGDRLIIQFMLINQQFDIDGEIVWLKNSFRKVQAGIHLHTTQDTQQKIVAQLKQYAKQKRQ